MKQVVSSYIPFPPVNWWCAVIGADELILDDLEHFEKMSYRNKYQVAGANNGIQLSIPVTGGRSQRTPMGYVTICNDERWQVRHWRTLVSVYSQSPFWQYYRPGLEQLFTDHYTRLIDFNLATLVWLKQQLKLNFIVTGATGYFPSYPDTVIDLRRLKPSAEAARISHLPRYYQVFEDRIGFLPNLSLLDLLLSEGPQTAHWLKSNCW